MSDIDELSRMLGGIQTDILYIRKSTDAIDTKVDKAHENLIEVQASTKSAHKRIDEIVPCVEDYKVMKQRGIGITMVLGAIFGLVGASAFKIMKLLF